MRTIKQYKPGVARKVHIFSAALLWTIIGALLLFRGFSYLIEAGGGWLILPGIAAGTLKSYLVLDRSARSGLDRIRNFSDNTCIGAVYSWKTWLVVMAMMFFGFFLRKLSLPLPIVGTICVAIGWALMFSSRHAWKEWANLKAERR